jgi:hypothetical protein
MVNELELSKLLSKKSKFDDVVTNDEAIEFHASRFVGGQTDNLAKMCYQLIKLKEINNGKKA